LTFDVEKSDSDSKMTIINGYLYKILTLIDPNIIDLNYLLANVNLTINTIFTDSNILEFGTDANKTQLHFNLCVV
jgi:hypothetical protein